MNTKWQIWRLVSPLNIEENLQLHSHPIKAKINSLSTLTWIRVGLGSGLL